MLPDVLRFDQNKRCSSGCHAKIIIIMMIIIIVLVVVVVVVVIVVIALKDAIRDFSQSPQCAPNCLQVERSSGPGAVMCKSLAAH